MTTELRCDNKKHGIVVDTHYVEVKCGSSFCGAGRGIVVIHRFDIRTGQLTDTKKYREPRRP